MRVHSTAYLAALALITAGLGCASTTARTDESAGAAPADTSTTTAQDTATVQNPPGYRGMERDTTGQIQRETQPADTSGRTVPGMAQQDSTSGMSGMDSTTGMGGMDSTGADTTTAR